MLAMETRKSEMRRWLYENSLSIVILSTFILLLIGQTFAGWITHNEELAREGQSLLTLPQYVVSPHFGEATSENWESEFLQMSAYVLLTVFLRQKGSAESKPLEGSTPVDRDPRLDRNKPRVPWPVRRGGVWLVLYEYSLSIALVILFLISLVWHSISGWRLENEGRLIENQAPVSWGEFVTSAQFWFESLQNWQSEFLAVGSLIVFSIWLRQRGSPESKPVAAPHDETGD